MYLYIQRERERPIESEREREREGERMSECVGAPPNPRQRAMRAPLEISFGCAPKAQREHLHDPPENFSRRSYFMQESRLLEPRPAFAPR